jgi:hypothetical protein
VNLLDVMSGEDDRLLVDAEAKERLRRLRAVVLGVRVIPVMTNVTGNQRKVYVTSSQIVF